MDADESRPNDISGLVIGGASAVLNALGAGFLEKVYENALAHELHKAGLANKKKRSFSITYDDIVAAEFVADTIVERVLPVELEAVNAHRAQCIDYLEASGLQLGLLLNSGTKRLEIERVATIM